MYNVTSSFCRLGWKYKSTEDNEVKVSNRIFLITFTILALSFGAVQTMYGQGKQDTVTVWLFGDITGEASHDRQFIWMYTADNGSVVMQQNRQTSDGKSAGGNITFGQKFRLRKDLSLIATVGPAFNYDNPAGQHGFNHQLIVFLIGNYNHRWFRFSGLAKVFIPMNSDKAVFGDRHILTLQGPSEGTPRFLQGVALQFENWRMNGQARWLENIVGPMVNVGEIIGKPRSFWGDIYIYPYRDFCRPQPDHRRLWDVRIQYKHTFAISH